MYESEYQTTCPDCGVTHFKDAPCPYCYEVVEWWVIKLGNKALYRGPADTDEADRIWWSTDGKLKRTVTEGKVINRRADHPYED